LAGFRIGDRQIDDHMFQAVAFKAFLYGLDWLGIWGLNLDAFKTGTSCRVVTV